MSATRKSSSGFVSGSALSHSLDEEHINRDSASSSSSSSSTITIGSSFKSFVANHTRPFARDYSEFATSYLCDDVPFDRVYCDDSDSVQDIECKFKDPIPIQKFFVQQKCRKEFGPSVRQKYIIPRSQLIWNEIRAYNSKMYQIRKMQQMSKEDDSTDGEKVKGKAKEEKEASLQERMEFLHFKAHQWCEVTKALAMDHKYPKPDPNVVRKKYSEAHQKAIKLTRKVCGVPGKEHIFQPELAIPFTKRFVLHFLREIERTKKGKKKIIGRRVSISNFKPTTQATAKKKELTGMDIFVSYDPGQSPEDESTKEKWNEWANTLDTVFCDIKPLEELQSLEPHWQSRATKTRVSEGKPLNLEQRKKRFFKRNIYPPMTMEDFIAEKRKLLPPIKPEPLQTDYLSQIWEPELMIDEFKVTPLNYDSRLEGVQEGEASKVTWWVSHEAKQKCWRWLKSIPDNL